MNTPRTIVNTHKAYKEKHPDADLTEWAIRELVRGGKIPALMIGNKYLISLEALEKYINSQLGA